MLRMRNVIDTRTKPFPFVLTFQGDSDAPAATLPAHRLFQNDGSRIELAAQRSLESPLDATGEMAAADALDAFVDQAADALIQCTDFMRREAVLPAPDTAPTNASRDASP